MRKTKLILVALVISIMVMGAGYAYWSDTLTINNTVSTGELDVEIDVPEDQLMHYFSDPSYKYASEYVGITAEPTSDKKQYDVEITNLYPGAYGTYVFQIKNTGTIPAVIKDIVVTPDADNDAALWNELYFYSGFHKFNANGERLYNYNYANGTMSQMETLWENNLLNIRLEPGEYLVVSDEDDTTDLLTGVRLELPTSSTDVTENNNIGFSIGVVFGQHNE